MGTTTDKLNYLKDTKEAIKAAIVEKGVAVPDDTTFRAYADKVKEISGGGQPVEDTKIFKFKKYDGTVIAEYTYEEIATLSELPPLPAEDEYTIPTGWSVTVDDYKMMNGDEFYKQNGYIAYPNYKIKDTSNGSCMYIFINITKDFPSLELTTTSYVDWGDGTIDTGSTSPKSHTYSLSGDNQDFVIKVYHPTKGKIQSQIIKANNATTITKPNQTTFSGVSGIIVDGFSIREDFLSHMGWLAPKYILFCENTTWCDKYNKPSNKAILTDMYCNRNYPIIFSDSKNGTAIWASSGTYCYCGRSFKTIGVNIIYNKPYESILKIKYNNCLPCEYFSGYKIVFQKGQTIYTPPAEDCVVSALNSNYINNTIVFSKFTKIGYVISTPTKNILDYSRCQQVPSLSWAPDLANSGNRILVPKALYNEWIAATNWSALADYIEGV